MGRPTRPLLLATLVAALFGVWLWQSLEWRERREAHRGEHERMGVALLAAAEGAAIRECRGGTYDPAAIEATFGELLDHFGASRIAITARGEPLASAGETGRGTRFHKEFRPPRPRGRGRGAHGRGELNPLPDQPLEIELELPVAELAAKLSDDTRRFLVTSLALSIALITVAIVVLLRERSLQLEATVETSRERVKALEYLGRLGAGLAHETRNPLGVVRGFAQKLSAGPADEEEVRRHAATILEETDRTLARLDELLLLSRPAEPKPQSIHLRPLLEKLAVLVGPELDAKGASIRVDGAAPAVRADPEQARRLFLNLILNAAQAVGTDGMVEVRIEKARVLVLDDGPGIPAEIRDTLFEPYVSGREGGTGLGLSIATQISTAHGWALRYQPRDPNGTVLTVEIGEA